MQEVIVDCTTGAAVLTPLTDAQVAARAALQAQAAAQAQALAAEQAFRAELRTALAGVSGLLHGAGASGDATALTALVHKLIADPPQPLSAPEQGILARVILRALLP